MRVSKSKLREIIREELEVILTDDEASELFGDGLVNTLMELTAEDPQAATKAEDPDDTAKLRGGSGASKADVVKHEKERAKDVAGGSQGDFNRKENELVIKMEDFLTKVGQQDNLLKYLPLLQRVIDTIKKQAEA
tara:strand:+ start:771 stop:1175 length:405 start_codon:yes stop_codon:yes gene_type:complete